MLEAQADYGPLRKHSDYRIVKEGLDWYLVALKGKAIYVPHWVFEER